MEEIVGNMHNIELEPINDESKEEIKTQELSYWDRTNKSHSFNKETSFGSKCSICNRLFGFEGILHCSRCTLKFHQECNKKDTNKECFPLFRNFWVIGNDPNDSKNTPLIAFVNRKSGGHQGAVILKQLTNFLGPHQVFDLTEAGPSEGLQKYYKTPNLRILVAGGDGSVGWVLSEFDKMEIDSIPIAILPLGTGNDLSRSLNWGSGYSNEPLIPILKKIEKSKIVPLDRWHISIDNGAKSLKMNNYFSVGIDAAICLGFHEKRESNPSLFSGQIVNKMWYGFIGSTYVFSSEDPLIQFVHLEIDGETIHLDKSITGIIVLNLSSYAGGKDLWNVKVPPKNGKWQKASFSDEILEVVAAKGAFNAGKLASGIGNALKLGQGNGVYFKISKPIPMQVDGEPWRQPPCEIKISIYNQANFLFNEC